MAASRKKPADSQTTEIEIVEVIQGELDACILGTSPFVFNRVAEKTRETLLFPSGRLTKAAKAVHLKHDPLAEYRSSVYRRMVHEDGPTRLLFPAAAFKRAMSSAALDMPSVARTKIDRLTWALGHRVDMYGVPQMLMDVVRSANEARTPDIHTWAILPEWCCSVTIRFTRPLLSDRIVARLLAAAGLIIGVGDGRQEKGKRSFGQFQLVEASNEDYQRIMSTGGMAAQDAALKDPSFYDADTEDLFTWFGEEYERRAQDLRSSKDDEENLDEAAE